VVPDEGVEVDPAEVVVALRPADDLEAVVAPADDRGVERVAAQVVDADRRPGGSAWRSK
jgi:hypothetical protein